MWFAKHEVLKTKHKTLTLCEPEADAGGSVITLPGLHPGKLKTDWTGLLSSI